MDDGNGSFDGIESNDIIVNSTELKNNLSNRLSLPLSKQVPVNNIVTTVNGIQLPKFNTDSAVFYPQNNVKRFFVLYDVGISSEPGLIANASIDETVGFTHLNDVTVDMKLIANLPATANPAAQIVLNDTNVFLKEYADISPQSVVEGQEKIPMLYLNLQSESDIAASTFQITNDQNTFLVNNFGVVKIWIYEDINNNKVYDAAVDSIVKTHTVLENDPVNNIEITNIALSSGENKFLILYDAGLKSAGSNLKAQLRSVTAEAITYGSPELRPIIPASVSVIQKSTDINNIVANSIGSATSSFNISLSIVNNHSSEITVKEFRPRIYHSNISGRDITSEFSFSTIANFPQTLPSGETLIVNFITQHSNPLSTGTGIVDAYALYGLGATNNAYISRYQGKSKAWFPGAIQSTAITLPSNPLTQYYFTQQPYIETIKTGDSLARAVLFETENAIKSNSNMYIYFKKYDEDSFFINPGSIKITLNGVLLQKKSSEGSSIGQYSFDESTGLLTVEGLGTNSGTLLLEVNDIDNQPLNTSSFSFYISNIVELSNVYFYPNPYRIGTENLKLGFNLTRQAFVKAYLFNYLGQLIGEESLSPAQTIIGYNIIDIDKFKNYLSSGMFICKVVASDEDGNESIVITRLAIY